MHLVGVKARRAHAIDSEQVAVILQSHIASLLRSYFSQRMYGSRDAWDDEADLTSVCFTNIGSIAFSVAFQTAIASNASSPSRLEWCTAHFNSIGQSEQLEDFTSCRSGMMEGELVWMLELLSFRPGKQLAGPSVWSRTLPGFTLVKLFPLYKHIFSARCQCQSGRSRAGL